MDVASLFVIAAVAGFVEFVRRLWDRDFEAAVIIAGAAGIGALAGAYGVDGLSVTDGLIAGLAASGIITTAQKIG